MKRVIALLGTLVVLAALVGPSAAAPAPNTSAQSSLNWLRSQQQPDGGFAGLGSSSDAGTTASAAIAIAAAGVDPSLVLNDGHAVTDFLAASTSSYGASTGGAANLALAAYASGLNPHSLGGVDLIARIQSAYNASTGLYDPQLYVDAYAVLALEAARATVPPAALDALANAQAADGGWSYTGSKEKGQSDTNTTAVVIEALVAGGRTNSPVESAARSYLHTAQTADGSFVYQVGAENPPVGDANSTALVVQALVALGQDPNSATWGHAVDALRHFENADGAFRYRDDTPGDNLLATVQAIPALMLEPLPIAPQTAFGHATVEQRAMQPEKARPGCTYFAVVGHNLCAGFQAYWNQFGGLATYGYPLTEEFHGCDPQGWCGTMQYFERAIFEWHPGIA
ncbi:MAG TPA: prenyltransferase/squalene oxidase repeat-containing protein, partial [Thermomicrobiaceae bacterium]|nr:prenyltransferase/squalene oxidase repeat-containing protein [Thermomicrobiaceae bacterium]